MEKMNFQIDAAASSLKRKAINIAVVLPKAKGEDQYYFRGIWKGIKEAAAELEKYKFHFIYIESEYRMDKIALELQTLYDTMPVSYTHLDVYKRQVKQSARNICPKEKNTWLKAIMRKPSPVLKRQWGKNKRILRL